MKAVPGWRPIFALFLAGLGCAFAQSSGHVAWTIAADPAAAPPAGRCCCGRWARSTRAGTSTPPPRPNGIPTSFQVGPPSVVEGVRLLQPPPKRAFDTNFQSDTETYEGDVTFLLELRAEEGRPGGPGAAHDQRRATRPATTHSAFPRGGTGTAPLTIDAPAASAVTGNPRRIRGAEGARAAAAGGGAPQDQGIGAFLLVAFGFGLASIFTPCVFPMIPITMSYFLNRQSGGRRDGIVQAVVFCLGIIVLFSGLGLAITAVAGTVRHRATGLEPLGERVHLGAVHRLRPEPAGGVRDHDSVVDPDAPQPSRRRRAASPARCSWG